jgi:hypothetical protein
MPLKYFLQAPVYPKVDVGRAREEQMLGDGRLSRRRILVTDIILAVLAFRTHSPKRYSGVFECTRRLKAAHTAAHRTSQTTAKIS